MQLSKKFIYSALLFFAISLSLLGQEAQDSIETTIEVSKTVVPENIIQKEYSVEDKYLDERALEDFRSQDAFIYDKERPPKTNGWWDRFWYKVRQFRIDFLPVGSWWAVLKYGFFALVIIYIVRKLFGADLRTLFYNKAEINSIEYETISENIHELDYNKDIQAAIQQGNYRKAVRLYYLKSLKVLADKEIIQWKMDKTNGDYRREIGQSDYAGSFGEITRLFDYVWYGEFPVDKPLFDQTEQKFQRFIQTVGK